MRKIVSLSNLMIASATLAVALFASTNVQAGDAPELKCPVSGEAASKEHALEHNGGKVYFCCDDCPKKFQANTKKYTAKANAQMVVDGQFKQVKCPLQGKPVNPAAVVEVDGVKVAFCCNGCKSSVAKAKNEKAREKMVFNDKAFKTGFEKVATDEKK